MLGVLEARGSSQGLVRVGKHICYQGEDWILYCFQSGYFTFYRLYCSTIYNFSVCPAKDGIIRDAQRPEGLEKIRQLEEAQPFQRPEIPEAVTRQRPVFTQPLQNIDHIAEGATAHFECRLIPVGDPTLKVEWFRNEKPLETSE